MQEKTFTNINQHIVDRWASCVLRIGVWSSALLMGIGLILAAVNSSQASSNLSLSEIAIEIKAFHFPPHVIILSGLIVLMFTPILRVAVAVIGFMREKDRRFVVVALVVLVMLISEIVYSVFIK